MIDTSDLEAALADFASKRDWEQFHTPKNLTLALVGEVGELCELVQWKTDSDVFESLKEPGFREALADELADVLIYLTRIASTTDIDLGNAVEQKILKNAERYPASEVRGSSEKRS